MRKFYVFSAGCIRRGLEVIHIQKYLLENGWNLTKRINQADMVIVATCGVVRLNEINSLKAIADAARKRAPSAEIVVTGCLPLINPAEIEEIGDFTWIPSGQLEKFDDVIAANTPIKDVPPPDSIADNQDVVNYLVARSFCRKSRLYRWMFHQFGMSSVFLAASVAGNKMISAVRSLVLGTPRKKIVPYYNIKIADGCMSECTFCATKLAIGSLRSKPLDDIVVEFKNGLAKGYKVFQLISEDTGCYGLDCGTTLGALVDRLCAIDGQYQLVIIDCSPQWLVEKHDEIVTVLIRQQDKIKELFAPIQSGSNRVLTRMNRLYDADQVKSVFQELNERAPGIGLRTGLLVGFPGETEEDFEATKQFVADVNCAEVTVNRYEDRPGTESSKMSDKVAQETIEQRAQVLADELNCRILS